MQDGSTVPNFRRYADRYPPPEPAATDEEAATIAEHAAHLASGDKRFFRELIGALNRRRSADRQMDPILGDDDRDFGVLLNPGELIVRTDLVDPELLRTLRAGGVIVDDGDRVPEHPVLQGKLTRFPSALKAEELRELARRLRAAGYPVSANHITPLNPWVKGKGGPEPTKRRPAIVAGDPLGGPVVAVIDTGIADPREDGWLHEIARAADRSNIDELKWNPADPDERMALGAGHGTFACGLVTQASQTEVDGTSRPAARVVAVRALDVDGIAPEVDVAAAMVQAVHDGARILNLSLGTQTLDDQPPVALQVALELIDAYDEAGAEHGPGRDVVIVAAAGNYGDSRPCWPAAFKRVLAVGALTGDEQPAVWSSRGSWVDCSTIGQGVVSTFVEGKESLDLDPDEADSFGPGEDWAAWYGTSFAAPQIAGLIAWVCADRNVEPRAAVAEILRSGRAIPDFGQAVAILSGT